MTTALSDVRRHCRGEFERPYSELSPWRLRRRGWLVVWSRAWQWYNGLGLGISLLDAMVVGPRFLSSRFPHFFLFRRFSRRSTPAYLGRYIRAFCRASSSSVHYAFSGVWSLAPPLRLQGRAGVFHRRAAPPHRPTPGHTLLRGLARSFLRPPGFALSGRGRQPLSVAFPSSRTTPLALRHRLHLLGPRAGSLPRRHRSSSAPSRVSPCTLRGLLHLSGRSGGFQAAKTGLLDNPKNKVFLTIISEAIDALLLLNSSRVLKHSIRECIRRGKTAAVGATLARRCHKKDRHSDVTLWDAFSGIFPVSRSVPFPSFPAFLYAGSFQIVLSWSRWSLLPLSVPFVAWTRLTHTNSGQRGQFRVLPSWHFRIHHVVELRISRAGCLEGFFLIWRILLKFELQVRSSSERLRRGQ